MLLNKRRHFFEFCDQSWLPKSVRQIYMECLNFAHDIESGYALMVRKFVEWVDRSGGHSVVDLASGGANHIKLMLKIAKPAGIKLPRIVLTDLFPQLDQYQSLQQQGNDLISFAEQPVAVNRVPDQLGELRSMFSALHHFTPEEVRLIFADSLKNGKGIFIAEPFERSWRDLLVMLLGVPLFMLYPLLRRFSIKRFVLCTLVPVIPLTIVFDGVVSVLRCYKFPELLDLLPQDQLYDLELGYGTVFSGKLRASMYFHVIKKQSGLVSQAA